MKNTMTLALAFAGLMGFAADTATEATVVAGAHDSGCAEIAWTRSICVEKDRYIGWPTVCRLLPAAQPGREDAAHGHEMAREAASRPLTVAGQPRPPKMV